MLFPCMLLESLILILPLPPCLVHILRENVTRISPALLLPGSSRMHATAEEPPTDDGRIPPSCLVVDAPPPCLAVDAPPPCHSVVDEVPSVIVVGPSSRAFKVYSSTAAAIANFKPTPREIISGIAPHVFDEHNLKRRYTRPPRSHSKRRSYIAPRSGGAKPSPLRGSAVISWDECSIYVESEHRVEPEKSKPTEILTHSRSINSTEDDCAAVPKPNESLTTSQVSKNTEDERPDTPINSRPPRKHDKRRWRKFRLNIFKTFIVKLNPALRVFPS